MTRVETTETTVARSLLSDRRRFGRRDEPSRRVKTHGDRAGRLLSPDWMLLGAFATLGGCPFDGLFGRSERQGRVFLIRMVFLSSGFDSKMIQNVKSKSCMMLDENPHFVAFMPESHSLSLYD